MKILVTGASGFIGTLVRDIYQSDSVTVVSRSTMPMRRNETYVQSKDLTDNEWWASYLADDIRYDLVFHFAEPLKRILPEPAIERIIQSHTAFLKNISTKATRVVYPLTAYRYDAYLSEKKRGYLTIKESVFSEAAAIPNICFPVFHPVIDAGNGLHKMIKAAKCIPLADPFYKFDAQLPVLYSGDLTAYLRNVHTTETGIQDVYSEIKSISEIFANSKHKSALLSTLIKETACVLSNFNMHLPMILIHGRTIPY